MSERKLKLADLKQRAQTESALLAVRLPGKTMDEIRTAARTLNIRMRALVLALLNEGLDAYDASRAVSKSASKVASQNGARTTARTASRTVSKPAPKNGRRRR